jgi:hypothetical protein
VGLDLVGCCRSVLSGRKNEWLNVGMECELYLLSRP